MRKNRQVGRALLNSMCQVGVSNSLHAYLMNEFEFIDMVP